MWPDYPFISPPAARSSPPPPAPLSSAAPPDGAVDMYYVQQLQSFGKACGMDMSSRIPGRSLFRKSRIETNDTINSPRFDRKPEKAAVLHVAAATRAIGGWPHRPAQKPCALLHPPPPLAVPLPSASLGIAVPPYLLVLARRPSCARFLVGTGGTGLCGEAAGVFSFGRDTASRGRCGHGAGLARAGTSGVTTTPVCVVAQITLAGSLLSLSAFALGFRRFVTQSNLYWL